MKHERHVKHLLIRFVTNQLSPRKCAYVRTHVASCLDCRALLALQEELISEIKQAAVRVESPVPDRVSNWWNVIRHQQVTRSPRHQRSVIVSLFAPVTMSLLLLAAVLATEVSNAHAAVSATYGGPAIDTTLEPTSRAYLGSDDQPIRPETTATPDVRASVLTIPAAPSPAQTD